MKLPLLTAFALFGCFGAAAQSFGDDVHAWQEHYKQEFLTDPRSPVKEKDTAYLRFFPAAAKWRLQAEVVLTPEALPFDMATHSGKTKRFRQYAKLKFPNPLSRKGQSLTLSAFERVDRPASDTQAARTLFIPFQDKTNGSTTYGGGRYMDVMKTEIEQGKMLLDFNKAYNPYCAFGEGFSCPIPPDENRLSITVQAGEKLPAPPLLPKDE